MPKSFSYKIKILQSHFENKKIWILTIKLSCHFSPIFQIQNPIFKIQHKKPVCNFKK